jgi:hypothetical protein
MWQAKNKIHPAKMQVAKLATAIELTTYDLVANGTDSIHMSSPSMREPS